MESGARLSSRIDETRYDAHDISVDMQAGEWARHEGKQPETAMSGFNTRLPTAVLKNDGARHRAGPGHGHRRVDAARSSRRPSDGAEEGDDMVLDMSVLACRRRGIPAPPGLLTSWHMTFL